MADGRQDNPGGARPRAAPSREERLKAALKANIARRKAQGRALGETSGASAHFPGGDDPPLSEKD